MHTRWPNRLVWTGVVVAAVLAGVAVPAGAQSSFDPSAHDRDWTLDAVQVEELSTSPAGAGVTVAIVEPGGIDPDTVGPLFDDRLLPMVTVDDGDVSTDGVDGQHARAMAAVVAGNPDPDRLFPGGVARRASVVSVPIGETTPEGLAAGIRAATEAGADVVNISAAVNCRRIWVWHWCGDDQLDTVAGAVADARDAGAVVVAGAGNYGPPCGTNVLAYPQVVDDVIAVGASTPDGATAPCMSTGAWVDVLAPGDKMWLPYDTDDDGEPLDDGGGWATGTSAPSALVSGLVAALLSWGYDPADIEAAIGAVGPDTTITVSQLVDELGPPPPADEAAAVGDGGEFVRQLKEQIADRPRPAPFGVRVRGPSDNDFTYGNVRWDGTVWPQLDGSWSGTVASFFSPEFQYGCDALDTRWQHAHWTTATVTITRDGQLTWTHNGDLHYWRDPRAAGTCGSWWLPTAQVDRPSSTDRQIPLRMGQFASAGTATGELDEWEWPDLVVDDNAIEVFDPVTAADGTLVQLLALDGNPLRDIVCSDLLGDPAGGCDTYTAREAETFVNDHAVGAQVQR